MNFKATIIISLFAHLLIGGGAVFYSSYISENNLNINLLSGNQSINLVMSDSSSPKQQKRQTVKQKNENAKEDQSTIKKINNHLETSPNNDETKNEKDGGGANSKLGVISTFKNGLHNPHPTYPSLAKRWGWSGTVFLRFHVLNNGKVDSVQIIKSSGYSILDQAAAKTVKNWRFPPPEKSYQKKIEIDFKFEE